MIKNLLILILIFFCLKLYSQDNRWVYVTSDEQDSIDYYYDSLSIIYTDSSIIIWAKFLNYGERIYSDPRTSKFNKLYYNTPVSELTKSDEEYIATITILLNRFKDYILYQYEFICNERKYRKLDNIEYFMDGNSYHSKSAEYGSAIKRKILPETFLDYYLNKVCK